MKKNVSIVGLGKLGLCLAACYAKRGFNTIGVDIEQQSVEMINKGISPIIEPLLDQIIAEHGGKTLKATTNHCEAIENSDVTFILTATPSMPDGSFSNCQVEAALTALAQALRESNKKYHLFVISSTVVPGSTDDSFIPLIESNSGKKLNVDFGVCFDPDFVALGQVVKDFLNPDLIIIGESSKKAGDILEKLHLEMCENNPPVSRMSLISGEIAKVSLNAYITMKISFANTVANICEKIPGADVDSITQAIGHDKRISPFYFKGGLSFGGTCFPRDTRAFITIADKHGNNAAIIKAVEEVNRYQSFRLTELVLEKLAGYGKKKVGILGLAFKPKTPVVVESPAIKLIQDLIEKNIEVVCYDPLAKENTFNIFKTAIQYASSAEECISKAEVCVITNPDAIYKDAVENYAGLNFPLIVDCWRILNQAKGRERFNIIKWGYKEEQYQ